MLAILGLVKNIGFLVSAARSISSVVAEMIQGKKLPECSQATTVIDILEEALRRKIIDLPNVDEEAVANWLSAQKKEIFQCKIPQIKS